MKEEKVLNIKFMIMAIICICLFVVAIVPKELQNDTFYTIKLGELILENGIDMQEHFAWHEGLPYTYPHWLYDVIMYLVFAAGGFTGVYVSSIVLGIALGIIIYLTNAKLTKNTVIPFFTTILILYVGKDFITARAQLITFILFVLTIYYIERFLETKKKRYAVGLLVIPTAIANIHAAVFPFYFVLYLPYIGEYIISLIIKQGDILTKLFLKSDELEIKKLEKKESLDEKKTKKLELLKARVEKNKERLEEKKNIKKEPYKVIVKENKNVAWLMIIMVFAALTGLLTPIGDTPYTYLLHTMQGTTTQNIAEHLPTILYYAKVVLAYIVIAICLISFTKIKIRLSDLFLLGGLIFLTIMSRRQASMLYFVGILVMNRMICTLIEMYDKDGVNEILRYFTSIIGRIIIYTIFAVYMVFSLKGIEEVDVVSKKSYPVEATEFIKNNLDVENIRLYNEYNFGSYLLHKEIPVFIDSRADLYLPEFNEDVRIFDDFLSISSLSTKNLEGIFDKYGFTHFIVNSKAKLTIYLDAKPDEYSIIYSDEYFYIYERKV